MRIVWICLKWAARTVLVFLFAILIWLMLWPLPSIRPVRIADPKSLSPEAMLIFTEEVRYANESARLLLKDDGSRGMQWHLRTAVLSFRLVLFTSERQRAAFLAHTAYFGFGTQDFPTFTQGCFGKQPDALDLAAAAELVKRMRSPARFKAADGMKLLLEGRDKLLKDLAQAGKLNAADLEAALAMPLGNCGT